MEGFYGVEVAAGKQVSLKIPEEHALRLTQLALPANASAAISLIVSFQGKQFTIATLDPKRNVFQMSTDLVFTEPTTLTATGAGCVHVTGYVQPVGDDVDSFAGHDFDDDEEEEMVPKKKNGKPAAPAGDDEEEEDEEDEDEEVDGVHAEDEDDEEEEDDED
ncbi:nucleolar RNA-binding protein, partial [Trypanosoma conorhini]